MEEIVLAGKGVSTTLMMRFCSISAVTVLLLLLNLVKMNDTFD